MMMEKIRKILKSKGGFTLVELLVVIVVLGILAGVGIQQFGAVQSRANTTVDNANQRILKGAAQMYIFEELVQNNDPDGTFNETGQGNLANYVDTWPVIPADTANMYQVVIANDGSSITINKVGR